MSDQHTRRAFLGTGALGLGAAGMIAGCSHEERILRSAIQEGRAQAESPPVPGDGALPAGRIGNVTLSRVILGGNLLGGWAHARDLIYVSRLVKAYNTESKVFDTLELAEQSGVNAIQIDPMFLDLVAKYKRQRGGKIQMLVCMEPEADAAAMRDQVRMLVDRGGALLYLDGEAADRMTMARRIDVLGGAIDAMKAAGVPAGIGSHSLETPRACQQQGLDPDFYVKTYHLDRYWSATPKEHRQEWCWYGDFHSQPPGYHDNIWCLDPDATVAFFESVEKPWVAFKVLAAGAIHPRLGIASAFRNGADFVLLGMFDFQIAQNVALAREALERTRNRKRPWRA
jgi:hypothetical protein